jgi:DNA invertase Pin-like site-specific DNA recombinase
LARSLPDTRDIVDELTTLQVRLNLGGSVHDPNDPVGRLLFNVLAMVAEFESDPDQDAHPGGLAVARAAGKLRGRKPKLSARQEAHLVAGTKNPAELVEQFGVGRSTVYRTIERAGDRSTA